MEKIKEGKDNILTEVANNIQKFSDKELREKKQKIEEKLFEFANFIESRAVFLYTHKAGEISPENIIKTALKWEKQVILPIFSNLKNAIRLYKITNWQTDLVKNENGMLVPDTERCKKFLLDDIDIAIIPGLAFDDKGGRLGFGDGFYKKLITSLPETCRKISLAFEEQIVDQLEIDSRKYTVDIIITDKRIIYKI